MLLELVHLLLLNSLEQHFQPLVAATTGLTLGITDFVLGDIGFQSLDFDQATTTMTQDTETLTYTNNIWSSRTATVPSPGSQKLSITAVVKDRYYFKLNSY